MKVCVSGWNGPWARLGGDTGSAIPGHGGLVWRERLSRVSSLGLHMVPRPDGGWRIRAPGRGNPRVKLPVILLGSGIQPETTQEGQICETLL
jgi:hypothetical protein